jgi:adenylate cyclase
MSSLSIIDIKLRKILSTPGRLLALAVLALLVFARLYNLQVLATIRLRGFDLEQHLMPRLYEPAPLRIVAIDEKSLERYGQWPWPRTLMARLVSQIAAGKPLVLGVDIIFAEPDRFSPASLVSILPSIPESIARELASLPGNDAALAAAFRQVPTVLGEGMSIQATSGRYPQSVARLNRFGTDPTPFLLSYPQRLRSLPDLRTAALGEGALLAEPDADGILRRMPLFVLAGGNLLPSISLEMLRVAFKIGSVDIVTAADGVQGAMLGHWFIPTDRRARAYPYFTQFAPQVYVSAADLLDGSYDSVNLRGRIVFLGVTALGLTDQKQTPFGLMSGTETQVQLIDSVLTRNLLWRPPIMNLIELAVALGAGLFTIFALPYRRPSIAGALFVGLVVTIVACAFASFLRSRVLFDATYPSFATVATYGVMLAASLRATETARRRLASDLASQRERQAHLEGELSAARAIQMGLLPRRFPAFSQRRDFDIYASIEPARMVGGDLYDFALLDPRRLSFVIADVSGDGVAAALFMAMSKEVLRAATLRHGDALERVFAEANAEILAVGNQMAEEGADTMFVTVFAGILDLTSGKLIYLNAGHDAPFVLKQGTQPRQLAGAGGPPLGAVENFPYALEKQQLTPGELLLPYTDGVTDAQDPTRSFYAVNRLQSLLASAPITSAKAMVDLVLDDLRRFANGADQADDITLLAIRWLGAEGAVLIK